MDVRGVEEISDEWVDEWIKKGGFMEGRIEGLIID